MRHIKLKDLINESYISSSPFEGNLNEDLKYLEQKLIEEGLWDVIKQKVGDASNKTKEILLKPLIKLVVDKIAKDDPQGFSKLQQYSADQSKIKDLLNHPDIKKKESEIGREVASVKESLSEAEHDDFIQEYIDAVLDEARVLRDDPRNVKRRERYQQRKAARAGQAPSPAAKKTDPAKVDKSKPSQPKNDEPTAGQNIKQGAAQLGKGIAQGADKFGIAAIEKGGDLMAKAMGGVGKGVQALAQTEPGKAVGGLLGKIYQWAKANPKITAAAGIALLGLIGTAAAIGSGGIAPLIATTVAAAGGGAVKGGAIGSAIGAGKEMYSQIKGGTKSFKDMNYGKVGKAALKKGGKGAAIGAAIAGGGNILGKAAAGITKMFSSGHAASNPNDFLKDLTPQEERALGIEGRGWAEKFNPDDMKTWQIKPAINSVQGYQTALKQNELLYKSITGHDATELVNAKIHAMQAARAAAEAAKIQTDLQTGLDAVRNSNDPSIVNWMKDSGNPFGLGDGVETFKNTLGQEKYEHLEELFKLSGFERMAGGGRIFSDIEDVLGYAYDIDKRSGSGASAKLLQQFALAAAKGAAKAAAKAATN